MSPTELWWWFEAKLGVSMVGGLTEDEADGLVEMMQARGI